MSDIINALSAILTIGFGLFGFLAPRFTARALDLKPDGSTMGLSEMRASVGGLFVIMGMAALVLNDPLGFAMLGFAYAGAACGRILSGIFDHPPLGKLLLYGGIEAALAAWLLSANIT